MKKFLTILAISVTMMLGLSVHADTPNPKTDTASSYIFHLYYNSGALVPDRDFKFPYNISGVQYVDQPLNTTFPYHGEIVDMTGQVGARFTFDPRGSGANFIKGKITVSAPYLADGKNAIFYNTQNQPVLTVPVDQSSYCNDDGICNADRGENSITCSRDCRSGSAVVPGTTATASGGTSIWTALVYILLGLLILAILWILFKKSRAPHIASTPIVPTLPTPPSVLPTPPAPPQEGNDV